MDGSENDFASQRTLKPTPIGTEASNNLSVQRALERLRNGESWEFLKVEVRGGLKREQLVGETSSKLLC